MRFWLARALLAALGLLLLLELLVIVPRAAAGVLVAAVVWMALPGVVLARVAFGGREASGIAAWLVGPSLGLGISVLGAFLVWALGVQNWAAIVLGPALTWLAVAVAWRYGAPAMRLPAFDRRDASAVAIALLVVPLITWAPYDHVREPVPEGEGYRAYFTADFIFVALRRWPFALFLSFGPLLLAGACAFARVRWVARAGRAPAALALVAIAFYFLVDVPDMEGVWVGWRSGHQLLIAFAIGGAAALTAAWRHPSARAPLAALVVLVTLPAVPTVAIDVYNAQDIENRHRGPSFPWTLVITPHERDAFEWIKRATPRDALVQVDAWARGGDWWATIPALAERRMAAGLPGAMIPFQKFQNATDNVRMGIFSAPNPDEAHAMADFLGIDYLYVGDVERFHYRPNILEWAARRDLFPEVFRNDMVTIYGVTHKARADRHHR